MPAVETHAEASRLVATQDDNPDIDLHTMPVQAVTAEWKGHWAKGIAKFICHMVPRRSAAHRIGESRCARVTGDDAHPVQ
jgi:hypothetical protein